MNSSRQQAHENLLPPMESVEQLLMRARVDLAEIKRTGAQCGLSDLLADVAELKSEVDRYARFPLRRA